MSQVPDRHRLPSTGCRALTVLLDTTAGTSAARHRLSATDIRALICLLDRERAGVPAGPTWLSGELRVTTASVTALLDRLERSGHVRRTARTDDRRRVDVVVQESAEELGSAFSGPLIDATADVLAARTDSERAVIEEFLDDMVAAVGALTDPVDDRGTPRHRLGSAP